jgi:hypothetical protein
LVIAVQEVVAAVIKLFGGPGSIASGCSANARDGIAQMHLPNLGDIRETKLFTIQTLCT